MCASVQLTAFKIGCFLVKYQLFITVVLQKKNITNPNTDVV